MWVLGRTDNFQWRRCIFLMETVAEMAVAVR
jgi:hypothetical protein